MCCHFIKNTLQLKPFDDDSSFRTLLQGFLPLCVGAFYVKLGEIQLHQLRLFFPLLRRNFLGTEQNEEKINNWSSWKRKGRGRFK
jgi:hypothetical protein